MTAYAYCSVDFDSLELRALAQTCLTLFGRSKMAEALRAGKDLHLQVASTILGISYEEAEKRKKEPEVKNARQLAKVANFGFPGGLGAGALVDFARMSYGVTLTADEAKRLKQQFLTAWPEIELFFRYVAALPGLEFNEAKITHLVSKRVRGGLNYTAALNSHFQSLAADGAKAALFAASYECYCDEASPLYGSRIVNFVHDEIIAEVPVEVGHEAAARLTEIMIREMARYIPDVPITASPVLMTHWSKDAEAVFVDGRLCVWTPPDVNHPEAV